MVMAADEGYAIVIRSRLVIGSKPHSLRVIGSRMIATAIHMTTGSIVTDKHQRMVVSFTGHMLEEKRRTSIIVSSGGIAQRKL